MSNPKKLCGLIINPIAGMGGAVGLKGTDGEEILQRAIALGAVPRAPERAREAVSILKTIKERIEIVTGPDQMGQRIAKELGFDVIVYGKINGEKTTAENTRELAVQMKKIGVDLILFAGGDGTARDILESVGKDQPCLGIPAGVKIQSAVYALNPIVAGELASLYLQSKIRRCIEAEVMDIDEDAYRKEVLNARLYGYLQVPQERSRLQRLKLGSSSSEKHAQEAIAHDIFEQINEKYYYIIGAGSTLRPLMELLNFDFSLLGVDIFHKDKLILNDARESEILEAIEGKHCKLIVTPVGGQGYILGRGNLQLSPRIIKKIGKENIIIAATSRKLQNLNGRPLLSDTGDRDVDKYVEGIYRIVTGYHQSTMYRVKS